MRVKLRRLGDSKILMVPEEIKTVAVEYEVANVGTTIVFTPVQKHQNVFATKEWQEYDYQRDMAEDPAL
ncbi:hypothetical protein [uncultured Limosilactobacillus sp.]|uniref:hypothetical protein n=1 Tax=uncultured Limosilactobacillus sp. TaxID=2837629 RepID=UPI0025E65112|nr:hypothetical protein [uncultured Limosilactobacillus sp.]